MSPIRHPALDQLRSLAALAVVWLHVAASVVVRNPDPHSLVWWLGNVADAASRWCVPVFLMISGALLLDRSAAEQAPLTFLRRRYQRLAAPWLFWTVLYFGVTASDSPLTLQSARQSLFTGTPWYHLWYLYMLFGLYLVTPALRRIVATCNHHQLGALILCCFMGGGIEVLILHRGENFFLWRCLPLLGYFLAGHYLFATASRRLPGITPGLLLQVIGACVLLIAAGTAWLLPGMGLRACTLMYAWQNPLVIIMSLAIFSLLLRSAGTTLLGGSLQRLAPLSFGIYLLHPLWLLGLGNLGVTAWRWHPALGIPLLTLVVVALSALTVQLMRRTTLLRPVVS